MDDALGGSVLATCMQCREASSISPKDVMIDPQARAIKLIANCFTGEELEKLNVRPEFEAALKKMVTVQDALDAIDIGQNVLREDAVTFRRRFLDGARNGSPPPPLSLP